MNAVYMRQAYMGTVGDMKNLEYHFTKMAENGWLIDKIGVFTHRYRAVEPCKKRFFVDLLPQITAFDYPENEDAIDYRSICEESGWTFVAANKQFHVFCADEENPTPMPIHTDNKIQAQIYLKACIKYELPMFPFCLLMLILSLPLNRGAELFLSNIMLFMMIGFCCFFVGYMWTFGFIIRWYIRTRKSARNDLPMPAVNYHLARIRNKTYIAGAILYLVCMLIGITLEIIGGMPIAILFVIFMPLSGVFVGFWIRRQIDTKRRTRKANIRFSIIALVIMELVFLGGMGIFTYRLMTSPLYPDTLGNRPALTLTDTGITNAPDSSDTRIKGSVAFPVDYDHWETNQQGSVRTQAYQSISKTLTRWLYNRYSKEFIKRFDSIRDTSTEAVILTADEAALWGAEEGLAQFSSNNSSADLLLLNGKSILQLSVNGEDMSLESVSQAVKKIWRE